MDWYTLRVISGKEKKIKETILFELNTANLNESVENILVPTENVLEMRDGKKKIKEKVFFLKTSHCQKRYHAKYKYLFIVHS